ncbi:hypothetical protein Tco_0975328 [Tanacetum coccineum]|uniref:Uncharacterized protein n=1 Tax=Tanacetum coccineum TaxID=301880 RepID=A0ABQ5EE35_9ASTR
MYGMNARIEGRRFRVNRGVRRPFRRSHARLMEMAQSNGKNLRDTAIYGYYDLSYHQFQDEYRIYSYLGVSSLLKENEHLKLVYKNLFDSIKKTRVQKDNLRTTLTEFLVNHIFGKEDSSPSSTNELEKESGENICDNAKCEFQTKFIELEKVLTQQTKDFDDVKLELSNRTAKFEAYFEKLEKTKVVLERQLARKVDDSKAEKDKFLKEINHLRTQLENLKESM